MIENDLFLFLQLPVEERLQQRAVTLHRLVTQKTIPKTNDAFGKSQDQRDKQFHFSFTNSSWKEQPMG